MKAWEVGRGAAGGGGCDTINYLDFSVFSLLSQCINVYKPLFIYSHTYVCIYVFLFAYTGFRCSILYESYTVQCIRIQFPGKRIHLFDKKKENVKLDSYRLGLKLQCHAR